MIVLYMSGILHTLKHVLCLVGLKAGQGVPGKGFLETLRHHVIVLGGVHLELHSCHLAELVAMGIERGLIYLPIILEDVDGDALLVWKLGDSHRALVPPHDAAAVLESIEKCGIGGGSHLETFIFGELFASLLVDAWPNLLE
jgi:hypothetical protein